MIMAIVGTDGAGKTTLTANVVAALKLSGADVCCLDKWDIYNFDIHPECRFLKDDSLKLLRKCISEMTGSSRAMFIFWSIYMSMSKVDFDDGRIYVLDGYWMKHFATETLFGVDRQWVKMTAAQLPKPDLTIFLRVDPEEAYRRKARTNDFVPYEFGLDHELKQQSFLTHQSKVLAVLDGWAHELGWKIMDATLPEKELVSAVISVVRSTQPESKAGTRRLY